MYLIFDVETTGLPRVYTAPHTDTSNWPRIVQLAYALYDENEELLSETNRIIRPEGFEIPQESANIHGITTQRAQSEGTPLQEALEELEQLFAVVRVFVAHNAQFDATVLDAERHRTGKQAFFTTQNCVCTMKQSIQVCKLPGMYGYKYPRLEELYAYLFNESVQGAHNALIDVRATAKCYFMLRKKGFIE